LKQNERKKLTDFQKQFLNVPNIHNELHKQSNYFPFVCGMSQTLSFTMTSTLPNTNIFGRYASTK